MTIELRPYQARAELALRAALGRHRRVLLVAPTGAGKGVLIAVMAAGAAAKGKRVLAVVHRRELAQQTIAALGHAGFSPGVIAAGYAELPGLPLQVATVNTLARPQRLARWARFDPDLLIVDECHHLVARSWQRLVETWPAAYTVGFTATPLRLDGQGLGRLFGEMVVAASTKELIAGGYLAPVKHFVPPVLPDFSAVGIVAGDYAAEASAAVMRRPAIFGDAVEHYERLIGGGPALGYAANIAHSRELAEYFTGKGWRAAHVDADTPPAQRDAALAALAGGELKVVFNVGLFTEGIDLPALAGVLLLRRTLSLGLYLQMVGRALRPAPGKDAAVVIDHAGNAFLHGLADEDQLWSLTARAKKPREAKTALLRRCPECGAVMAAAAQSCPHCGAVQLRLPVPLASIAGELVAADPAAVIRARVGRMPRSKQLEWAGADRARLELVAELRGYRRGWAFYRQIEARKTAEDAAAA